MTDTHSALSQRSLLHTGALGGGAAVLGAYAAGTADGNAPAGRAALAAATLPAPPPMQNLFTLPDLDFETLFVFGSTVQKFTVADVAHRVIASTLVTHYQGDQLVVPPAKQGPEVFKLPRGDKQHHRFTAAEGAQFHCAQMAPQTRNQVVYDWLDGIL